MPAENMSGMLVKRHSEKGAPMLDFFEYNKLKYPCKTIYFSDFDCHYIIATEDLEFQLLPDGETYHSEIARTIDEQIFFYVPDEIFFRNNEDIAKFIGESF